MTGIDFAQLAVASGSAGGVFGLVFVAVRWTANFIAGRLDKREAQLDAGTRLLIEQLQTQVVDLLSRVAKIDRELEECRDEHAKAHAELALLRREVQGAK